jgi:hypothetical protein
MEKKERKQEKKTKQQSKAAASTCLLGEKINNLSGKVLNGAFQVPTNQIWIRKYKFHRRQKSPQHYLKSQIKEITPYAK